MIVKDASGRVVEEILLHGVGLGPLPVFSPAVATFKGPVIPPPSAGFGNVQGIAAEPDGKILILAGDTIYRFDNATGDLTAVPGLPPPASGFLPSFYGLATDAGGNIYYGYYSNKSSEIHRLDVVTGTDALIASDAGTSSMIVDPSGAIFYVQQDRVFRIAPNANTPVAVAGDGIRGYGGDNGPALQAHLDPLGIALDLAGNLYIADGANHRVRKVDTTGLISTVAGTGVRGDTGDGGPALQAGLDWPSMVVADAAGDLYVSTFNGRIRRIDRGTGRISTVAGANPQTSGASTQKNPFLGAGFSASAQNLGVTGPITLDGDSNLWIGQFVYPSELGLYEISSSASPLLFPFTIAGQSKTQTVALLNAGTSDLSTPILATTGQNPGDFSLSGDCSGPVHAGSTCDVSITFTAGVHATPVATVTVSDNAVSSPQTIPVSGVAGGLAPKTQQVAATPVGSSSAAQPVTVQFPGTSAGLTAVLAYGKEFRLGTLSCSGAGTVSCNVAVTFIPLYPGLRQDAIQFLDSSGAVVYQCFLTGTGQGPQWFLDPGAMGSIPMPSHGILSAIDAAGNLYAINKYVAYDTGTEVYRFSKETNQWTLIAGQATLGVDTGDGGPATSATLSYVNAVALDSAGNLFIAETFAIRRVDARTGIIATIAQEGGESIAIDRFGYVYIEKSDKVRRLDPSTGTIVDFAGNGQFGFFSTAGDGGPATSASLTQVQALALDNDGNLLIAEAYHIRKVNVSSGIITTYANTCGANSIALDAAGDLYLPCGELTLVPAGPGTPHFVETWGFYNISGPMLRDPAGTFYTSNGTTLSPTLASPFQLPTAVVNGQPSSASIGLTNAGNTALGISSVMLTGENASAFSQSNTCGQGIAPAQNCAVNLAFKPAQEGTLAASLTVASTLPDLRTTLNGTGVIPSIYYSPQSIAFGNVPIPNALSYRSVFIQNTGSFRLSIFGISISGPNASDFALLSSCPATLMPYQWCTPYVVFRPSAAGVRTATLTITDDAAGSPHTIPLSATVYPTQINAGGFTLAQDTSFNFGSLSLVMQGDGNLVLYRQDGTAIWNTGTYGQDCGTNQCFAVFQGDGNLVVYNGSKPLWNSGTYGHPSAQLVFSGQAPQLEIIDGNQSILWTSVPAFQAGRLTLAQGAYVNFQSFSLVMQGDGNLVLYRQDGTAIWNTGTYGQDCGANQCFAAFQGDGNLVVYNGSKPLWNSGTYNHPSAQLIFSGQAPQVEITDGNQSILWTNVPAFQSGRLTLAQGAYVNFQSFSLVMQGDGNLVLYRQDGTPIWNTGTYGQNCGANQCFAAFQGDGNLVVYNGSKPLWYSGAYGPSAQLMFSGQAPQLEITDGNQSVLWAH
ncbi:MAG TPA: choice-of-anchor D domain-containing protein [Bryobacteraceae bacterium]